MKKLFITLVVMTLGAASAFAQDLASVTETFNNGVNSYQAGDIPAALASFRQALEEAEMVGPEAEEIAANCKSYIPELQFSIAKELVNEQNYDEAVAALKKTAELANEYGSKDTADEATDLIPQVLMQKANALIKIKDFAGAVEGYKAVLEADPTNGVAALRLGSALSSAGDKDAALAAYEVAMQNGQAGQAAKQISNIYLKDAAADLKAKNYSGAVAKALKVNEYGENAKAYQIAAQASQSLKKNTEAIGYFEKYLELAPTAANATQIAFTVGALYQQAGNKAKAVEFYQKAITDPKFGPEAQKQINALK